MQKARSQGPEGPLLPLVSTRFQVLFHSPPGVLFTFPSRYSCTIGRGRVFSLGGWSPQIQPELLDSSGLLGYRCHSPMDASATGLSPPAVGRSRPLRVTPMVGAGQCPAPAPQPRTPVEARFGLLPFRSPLLRESRLISSPPGTEMFQFPGLASPSRAMTGHDPRRVSPFGHPWITARVRLPTASRSLPRPSSPARA